MVGYIIPLPHTHTHTHTLTLPATSPFNLMKNVNLATPYFSAPIYYTYSSVVLALETFYMSQSWGGVKTAAMYLYPTQLYLPYKTFLFSSLVS